MTGQIVVRRAFDHEKKETLGYILMCHVYDRLSNGGPIYTASTLVTLKVKDVDDKEPYINVRREGSTHFRVQTVDADKFTQVCICESLFIRLLSLGLQQSVMEILTFRLDHNGV